MSRARQSALLVLASATVCFAASVATQGDPMFILEVAIGGAVAAWAAVAVGLLLGTSRFARELRGISSADRLAGIDVRVVGDPAPRAFVAGVWRPTVFVTTGALEALAPRELRAVLLHEAHHARSRAPARAAFIDAWTKVVPSLGGPGAVLAGRLDALEIEADRAARAGGVGTSDIAAALVKIDPSVGAMGFVSGGEGRIRALLSDDRAQVSPAPLEWLPMLVALGLIAGCNLAGTASGL